MKSIDELVAIWERDAETLDTYADSRGAAILRVHAAQLREAQRAAQSEVLTLDEAAIESGYSKDHLRHLLAEGSLRNAGEKGRPRIRRGDLPKKPGADADHAKLIEDAEKAGRDILRGLGVA